MMATDEFKFDMKMITEPDPADWADLRVAELLTGRNLVDLSIEYEPHLVRGTE